MIAGVLATGAAGAGVVAKSWLGKMKGKKKTDTVAEEAPEMETSEQVDSDS